MNEETKLMIQNQMITNNLLVLLVASSIRNSTSNIANITANKLNIITDDMVRVSNELGHIK